MESWSLVELIWIFRVWFLANAAQPWRSFYTHPMSRGPYGPWHSIPTSESSFDLEDKNRQKIGRPQWPVVFLLGTFFQNSHGIGREGPSRWQDRLLGVLPLSVKRGEVCSVPVFDHQKPRKIVIFENPTWRFNEFHPENKVSMTYFDFVLVAHSEWLNLRFKMLNFASGQTCPCGDVASAERPSFWARKWRRDYAALSIERFETKFEDLDFVSNEHDEKKIEHISTFLNQKCYQWYSPFLKHGLAVSMSCWDFEDRSWRRSPSFLFTNPC